MDLVGNNVEECIKRNQKNAKIRSRRTDARINNYKPENLDVRLTSGNHRAAVDLFLNLTEKERRLNARRRNRKLVQTKKQKKTKEFNIMFLSRLEMLKESSPEYKQLLASREIEFALYLRDNNAEECLTKRQLMKLRKQENTNTAVEHTLVEKCNNFQTKFELSQRFKGLKTDKFYWETIEGSKDAKASMGLQGGHFLNEMLHYKNRDEGGEIEDMENLYYDTKIDQAMKILPKNAYLDKEPSKELQLTMEMLRNGGYKKQFTTEIKQLVYMILYNIESEKQVLEFNFETSSFELPDAHFCYHCGDGSCVCTLPYNHNLTTVLATPSTVEEIYGNVEEEMDIEEDDGKIAATEEAEESEGVDQLNDSSDEEEFDAGFC